MNLIHGDCLEELKKLGDKSVDFVYLDLPFGQTSCHWDVKLDLKALWVELRRVAKSDRTGFFFSCTTKFGFELFNNAPKGWFRWDLVWKKNRAAGFLNAYRLPMRKHEMIYCFAKKSPAYDVSSHSEIEIKPHNRTKAKAEIYGDCNRVKTDKIHKEPLPTSDVTPPSEEHELVYCFAKKSPAYDVSSHTEFIDIPNGRKTAKNEIYGESKINDSEKTNRYYKVPLPTSDITPPSEEHELVYCFAKSCPAYDTSSHTEYKEQVNALERPMDIYQGLKKNNEVKSKTHKEPLPTSDITQPDEEHELVYCFAKKSPAYDVSSHSEFKQGDDSKTERTIETYQNQKLQNDGKRYKEPLPTSDITPVLKEHKSDSPYGAGIKDVYHNGIKGGNKGSILPTSDITQEEAPSSWCEYNLDNKIGHRTAKPVKLMEFLLKYWTKEGDVVLDPTMGSGSMGVACKNMNRNFIGIEKDNDIFDLAFERLLTKN